jgi:hypothetical protein
MCWFNSSIPLGVAMALIWYSKASNSNFLAFFSELVFSLIVKINA